MDTAAAASLPPGFCNASRVYQVIITQVIFYTLSILVFSLRIFLRAKFLKSLGTDDLLMGLALFFATGVFATTFIDIPLGLGRHIECLSMRALVDHAKVSLAFESFNTLTQWAARLSIVFFALRLFAVTKVWRMVLYGIATFITIASITIIAIVWSTCTPAKKAWEPSTPGHCKPMSTLYGEGWYSGIVAVISDLSCAAIPLYFMWGLQLNRKLKLGVSLLLSLGICTAAFALTRTILSNVNPPEDQTYDLTGTIISYMECYVLIIAGTVPALRPLWTRRSEFITPYFSSLRSLRHDSQSRSSHTIASRPSRSDAAVNNNWKRPLRTEISEPLPDRGNSSRGSESEINLVPLQTFDDAGKA